jgi:hypothetical protein
MTSSAVAVSPADAQSLEVELRREVADCYDDPLRFVHSMYPWRQPGALQHFDGPDTWQREFLTRLGQQVRDRAFDGHSPVSPIRMAVSSGHGIGKSTMAAWLVNWIMATRCDAQGTCTANTFAQLQTKTWASVRTWTKLCLVGDWFTVTSTLMYAPEDKDKWFCSPQSCREENSESFAGQHSITSSSFYIFDESSAVPDKVFEVAEGGLTDGHPMMFLFGNPTRSQGYFHRACFGSARSRWDSTTVDSRESAFTNKLHIQEWLEDYGEASDFYRVRVRGLPPAASDLQYISSALVYEAQQREALALEDDPLVCGLDVARGGGDVSVFRFRRGADARSVPAIRLDSNDTTDLVSRAVRVLEEQHGGRRLHTLFVDATGIGGPIVDRLQQLGHRNVYGVQFGAKAPSSQFANMRAYIWGRMRDWLAFGAIDKTPRLEQDLVGPGYTHDKQDRVLLESKDKMKSRGVDSPDDGDALAVTFAASTVATRVPFITKEQSGRPRGSGWNWQ